jgi:protein-arginine kinase activator protein McsA
MKNREIIMRRLETIESNMSKLDFILKRQGSREEFEDVIADIRDKVNEAKAFVQQEPLSPGEVNPQY